MIGREANLKCRYDTNLPGDPVITWYKMEGQTDVAIATLDTAPGNEPEVMTCFLLMILLNHGKKGKEFSTNLKLKEKTNFKAPKKSLREFAKQSNNR